MENLILNKLAMQNSGSAGGQMNGQNQRYDNNNAGDQSGN